MTWPKLTTVLLITCCLFPQVSEAATLGAGDIAIIGFRGDDSSALAGNDDGFAWVPLVDLDPGQVLLFTDLGWSSASSTTPNEFFSSEGMISYTVGGDGVMAGTAMQLDFERSDPGTSATAYTFAASDSLGTYGNANLASEPGMLLSTAGDNLFVLDGTRAAPNFLFGLRSEGDTWQTDAGEGTANDDNDDSALPDSLINANIALGGPGAITNFDNARYIGSTSGTKEELLGFFTDVSNWERSDNGADFGNNLTNGLLGSGGSFNVVPEPASMGVLATLGLAGAAYSRRKKKKLANAELKSEAKSV